MPVNPVALRVLLIFLHLKLKRTNIHISGFLLLFFCLGWTFDAISQQSNRVLVRGIVMQSENDEFLVGAHIYAKVIHAGTTTNAKGKFELVVAPNDTLILTFIGLERQVIPMAFFRESPVDLIIRMDRGAIELPGITIEAAPDVSHLYRNSPNPYYIYKFNPSAEHPDLDIPVGSLDYGPLSRWGKEAKEKRKLLKIYQNTGQDRIYIQTVSSDSVMQVFQYMYDISTQEYNDFIIFMNTLNPRMDRNSPKDIIRVMHETFLSFKPVRE